MNEFDSGDEFAVYDTSANTTGKMTIANVLGTSITGLGTTATTIPGAISELNTGLGSVNTLLGSGDISSIGDGSVTGAISSLNNDLANHSTIIGNTSISGIGGGTLTGAVSALNSNKLGFLGDFTGNMNSIDISPGIYRLNADGSYTITGLPGSMPNPAYCLFIQEPYFNTQVILNDSYLLIRKRTGNPPAWRPWLKLPS